MVFNVFPSVCKFVCIKFEYYVNKMPQSPDNLWEDILSTVSMHSFLHWALVSFSFFTSSFRILSLLFIFYTNQELIFRMLYGSFSAKG